MTTCPPSGKQQDEPGRRSARLIPAAPAARRRRSAAGGGRCATIRPRPTATSQAATTMTISAKIWPSWLPCMREKATSARLPALSISSRQSRITSGLRRTSTPPAPIEKTSAETTRYQSMLIGCGGPPASSMRAGARRRRRVAVALRSRDEVGDRELARGPRSPARRRARMTAPTAATSSSSEATSNASRNLVRNSCADLLPACRSPRTVAGALVVERAAGPCRGSRCRAPRTARRRTARETQRSAGAPAPARAARPRRRRRRRRTRRAPSPRPRRRSPARRRRTPRAAAGTAPRATSRWQTSASTE